MSARIRASIVGGSGYTGGELLRLLLDHPTVEVAQVTSERQAGKRVSRTHPNLRGRTDLKFTASTDLAPCDVLFTALPHGVAMGRLDQFLGLAPVIVDLSADFRLRDAQDYVEWYGVEHSRPDLLGRFVYGIPELHRMEIMTASLISSAGCLATAAILSLWPLFKEGVADLASPVITEVKTGSSRGSRYGCRVSPSRAQRRDSILQAHRSPAYGRAPPELATELGMPAISFSATSIEAVRGVLATSHVFTKERLDDKALWQIYRRAYRDEPFIRIVKAGRGELSLP